MRATCPAHLILFFNIHFSLFSCFVCLLPILRILCLCIALCTVSRFVYTLYSCPFPTSVQVYRPLPQGGNPVAVHKYHIIYHIISYHIISCHIYHKSCSSKQYPARVDKDHHYVIFFPNSDHFPCHRRSRYDHTFLIVLLSDS